MQGDVEQSIIAPVALKSLGLRPDELDALAKQGVLEADANGYHRLRYRLGRQRRTKYVGKAPEFVAMVRTELDYLQHGTRIRRRRDQLTRHARECLRKTRTCCAPVVAAIGFYFRGFELRKCSSKNSVNSCGSNSLEACSRRKTMEVLGKDSQREVEGIRPASAVVRPKPDLHSERLRELYQSALDLDDPRRRNARFAMAELMDVGSSLADLIKQDFRNRPRTLKDLGKNGLRAISSLATLHRSACRYAQFERQLEATDESDAGPNLPSPDRGVGEV